MVRSEGPLRTLAPRPQPSRPEDNDVTHSPRSLGDLAFACYLYDVMTEYGKSYGACVVGEGEG
jgi:hypothetical protein